MSSIKGEVGWEREDAVVARRITLRYVLVRRWGKSGLLEGRAENGNGKDGNYKSK